MALDTYAALQSAILLWLARPGDALLEPSVPDMIRLFEAEAQRRLRVIGAERTEYLYGSGPLLELPPDFQELRHANLDDGTPLEFVPPGNIGRDAVPGGRPLRFTILGDTEGGCSASGGGAVMQLVPPASGTTAVIITYQRGLPGLSDTNPSNWLLREHPDCYLFGSLVEAEAFIGADERALGWFQRREATFNGIEQADRKKRWPGASLQIRPNMAIP